MIFKKWEGVLREEKPEETLALEKHLLLRQSFATQPYEG